MSDLKLIFAGTPEFAAVHLQALLDAGHTVVAVYTQPDRAAGRGKKLQASPVKQIAEAHGLPVFQPVSLRDSAAQAQLRELNADLLVVVAYGLLLPQAVLDAPRLGCINVHASVLPRWRGAAPIERALLAGDTRTGVTIMKMDIGLDTGDMLYVAETPISPEDTRITLESRLAELGCQALLHTLTDFESLAANAQRQDDTLSTYARKLDKDESLIDWQRSVAEIDRQIRASVGRNPAYTELNGERIRLLCATPFAQQGQTAKPGTILSHEKTAGGHWSLKIAASDGYLLATELQLPGKNAMAVRDVLNARRDMFAPGRCFGASS